MKDLQVMFEDHIAEYFEKYLRTKSFGGKHASFTEKGKMGSNSKTEFSVKVVKHPTEKGLTIFQIGAKDPQLIWILSPYWAKEFKSLMEAGKIKPPGILPPMKSVQ